MALNPAIRRYNRRVIGFSLLYAGALIGAVYAFKHHLVAGPLAYGVAILPALGVIGVFYAVGRYLVEEQDEYLRLLVTRQAMWASGFALSGATMWGFLENFDLVQHIDAYWIAVLWFAGLGVGGCINWMSGRGKSGL